MKTSFYSTASWKRQGVARLGMAALLTLCGPSLVYAQLSASDIAAMKQEIANPKYTFTVDENPATKKPLSQLCGTIPSLAPKSTNSLSSKTMVGGPALPSYWDWRQHNGVTPVKDQGGCGSCWAFSTVGTMEAMILLGSGITTDLSEQQLVSCDTSYYGCEGGNYAFDMEISLGAMLESCFPYQAADVPCQSGCPYVYKLSSWGYVGNSYSVPSTTAIKNAIYTYGPISVSVAVDGYFQGYSGGVFNHNSATSIDHAVVLVGWDDANGCWIMKNSWGTGWGESGYMRIAYGCDQIGYAAAYAVWMSPEPLLITPATGFTSTGGVGGPFTITSQSLTLTNAGTNSLTWTLANTSVWLNASPGGGTLTPGGPATTVTVSLNTAASNLLMGTYNATVWFTNLNSGVGQGRQFTLAVISPPTITNQPANQAVLEGATATFAVGATGDPPLSYQWQDNGTNLTDDGKVSGSTTTNLTINNVSAANVGTYRVIVTNFAGVATSSNALLTITPSLPVIITQPANQTAIVGGTAAFTVAAIGTTPFFYQWNFDGTNIDNATNAVLTLDNVQLTQAGNYAVVITNIYGTATSSNAMLNVYTVPVITSFSPPSGAAGTVVNISGLNFDPTPANNIVYFGGVEAVVSAASTTNLVVTVSAGATYAPITVTVNGLIAYANQPFMPRFLSDGSGITVNSFASRLDLASGSGPIQVTIADLDGDGKPDLIVANDYGNTISLYRNISTNGSLTAGSFAPRVDLVTPPGSYSPWGLAVADVDGDGKLDIIVSDYDQSIVSVYRNTCTPGNISSSSFATRVDFPVGTGPTGVAVQDLDGDGKPEIVTANYGGTTVSVLRNIGTMGSLTTNSFAPAVSFTVGPTPVNVMIADVDGDGKPDVVTVNNGNSSQAMSVLRNLSTLGNIAFATNVDFPGLASSYCLAIGDLDGDGKLDVVIGSQQSGQAVSVYRNTSTPGNITTNSFAAHVDFAAGGWVNTVTIGDVDGDGKPDVAAGTQSSSHLSLFKNTSTPGSFTTSSFAARVDFASGSNPYGVAIGDLDGDGRPDIVFANQYNNNISIYQNEVPFGGPPVIIQQPTNQTVYASGSVTFGVTASGTAPLSYQWSFGGTNIAGATNTSLTLTNVQLNQAGNYGVLVTNVVGSILSSNAVLTVLALPPSISIQPTNQTIFVGGSATFSVMAGGTPPLSYQWKFNGTNIAGATNISLTLTNVQLNQAGNYAVLVTNDYGSILSSNAVLTVLVLPPSISNQPTNQTVSVGGTATFSVMAGGTAPLSYQWNFNGTNIAGATNTSLTLTNVQLNQAGNYAVLVTNLYGSILSSNAVLTVLAVNAPAIFGFSPISGLPGTSVMISGTNFSPVLSNNIVYFGAVQATVSAASATNLVVTVPAGATYAPITETVNGLTACANAPFLVTFTGSGVINSSSLTSRVDLASGYGPFAVVIADLDGDGKPDLAVNNYSSDTISIYRNISTNGSLTAGSFAPRVDLATGTSSPLGMVAADVDGDGKLDLVLVDYNANKVVVLRNLSTSGNLTTNSFGAPVNFPVGPGPSGVAVRDLDGDGKPEIVTANYGGTTVSVLRNIGTMGTLTTNSFAPAVSFTVGPTPVNVMIADVDGDGKPDVVTVNNGSSSRAMSVLRNLSTLGNIAFATNVDFPGLASSYCLAIGDLDGDGKLDVVIGSQQSGQAVSVFRNTSTPGNITTSSFAAHVDFAAGGWVNTVAIGDVDGDGKPDVAAGTPSSSHLSLFKNTSTPGNFTTSSFAARVDFSTGSNPNGVAIGDLDGDGRPDIVFANQYNNNISIYQNVIPMGMAPVITFQPTNQMVFVGNSATFGVTASGTTPLSYQWNFNGTNIAGATNTSLTLTNVQLNQAGNYAVLVTNAEGSILSSNAVLTVNPLHHFVWNSIFSPQITNVPFVVSILAKDPANATITNFTGTALLSSTNGVSVIPPVSGSFVQGTWTGSVVIPQIKSNLVLRADDGLGHFGLANPINVIGLPTLNLQHSGNTMLILWPVWSSGFVLETSGSLLPATWILVTAPPVQIGDQFVVPVVMSDTNRFYRLRFPTR